MHPLRRILLATDFGASSARALVFASELVNELSAQLTLIHVLEDAPSDDAAKEAGARLAETSRTIRDIAPWHDVVMRHGRAAEEIIQCAQELDCDLVVVGTSGRDDGSRSSLGRVAGEVVRACSRPVISVRPGPTDMTLDLTPFPNSEREPLAHHDSTVVKVDAARAARGPEGQRYLASGMRVAMRLWEHEGRGDSDESQRDFEIVGYVLAGYAELHVEGQMVRLEPGDSYLVPRHARHRYRILAPFTAIEATSPPAQLRGRDEPRFGHVMIDTPAARTRTLRNP